MKLSVVSDVWFVVCGSPLCSVVNVLDIWLQVYASMSPMVHIVNIGSAIKESHANITVNPACNFISQESCLILYGQYLHYVPK